MGIIVNWDDGLIYERALMKEGKGEQRKRTSVARFSRAKKDGVLGGLEVVR